MEHDSKRIAREWNREIEAELRRLAGQQDGGKWKIAVWTVLEGIWLVTGFAMLALFSRLH